MTSGFGRLEAPGRLAAGKRSRAAAVAPSSVRLVQAYPVVSGGLSTAFDQSSWPPDLLVLLWPSLFPGRERGSDEQVTFQRILLVTLVMLADAGLLHLFLAEPGTSRWRSRTQPWVFRAAGSSASGPPSPGARPWLSGVLVDHIADNPGISCGSLKAGPIYTREAAASCGFALAVGGRWSSRLIPADETVALTESAALSLSRRWVTFTEQQQSLYRLMVRITAQPEGGS